MSNINFSDGYGMPSETADFDVLAKLCIGKENVIQRLLLEIHNGKTFEQWKEEVVTYLHNRNTAQSNYDWMLGGDEDMMITGYRRGRKPSDYVELQIEDASR